jgi:D-lactate dehydrogenase
VGERQSLEPDVLHRTAGGEISLQQHQPVEPRRDHLDGLWRLTWSGAVGEDAVHSVEVPRSRLAECLADDAGASFECTSHEAELAFLHRFAVAGAAVRYRAIHAEEVTDILALDIALRRNDEDWFEQLDPDVSAKMLGKLYYGHFLCHVFHQDYLIAKGADAAAIKDHLLAVLDARGAEYPAEHNVGHLYHAKPELEAHYRALDPRNQLNPGLGKTSRKRHWV